jgi:putative ATP-dependent endonuclease of OLD family
LSTVASGHRYALGEGDSEQVVLPRVLAAAGIAEDDASVSVVPLGGRHVNHFCPLLNELQIPHATLLDLDSGRFQGGWGRVRNALRQINKVRPGTIPEEKISKLPKWNHDRDFPTVKRGVFFSYPVDLDLMMLAVYPDADGVDLTDPDEKTIVAVYSERTTRTKPAFPITFSNSSTTTTMSSTSRASLLPT